MMVTVNLAVVDDNQNFLKSITRYLSLSEDIFVVGTACTKEQAIRLPDIYHIDVICMDINLTENKCDGIWTANQILSKYISSPPKLIMLTDYNNKELMQKSFLAGAVYYVQKTDFKSLPNIIRQVYNNNFPMGAVLQDYSQLLKDNILKTEFLLSNTENTILNLAESGNNSTKIIKHLCITESTYRKHVNNILKKIKAENLKKAIEKIRERLFI